MVLTAVLRIASWSNYASTTMFMLTIYLFLFAAIFMLVEFRINRAQIFFYFLNFTWGKAISYFCIGCLLVFSGAYKDNEIYVIWLDIVTGIWFFLMTLVFLIMHFIWHEQET